MIGLSICYKACVLPPFSLKQLCFWRGGVDVQRDIRGTSCIVGDVVIQQYLVVFPSSNDFQR